ncbi:MAG: VOC family protein [Cyclobacteriaceae bacterium]
MKSPLGIVPVLPTNDIERDVEWYSKQTGFNLSSGDNMYAVLQRDNLEIHLQWHAGTEDDPLLDGSVVKIFVADVTPIFEEFLERGTVPKDKLRKTSWGTYEFGFYDPSGNAIFFVQDL